MSISTSSHALSNTQVSLETAFKAKSRSVQTRSPSLSATALVITLTLALVSSIACVDALLTFTSSFGVFAAYACLVLCFDLTDPTLAVRTSASACTGTVLKSSFAKVKEHASRSCSLIVTSYFMTSSKTAFGFVLSCIISKYRFLRVLCFLQTILGLSSTFTRTALSVEASSSISLSVTSVTVASFYSLVCIVFRTANLRSVNFRIFVGFLHFLSLVRLCST
jgi:hypothetical protein